MTAAQDLWRLQQADTRVAALTADVAADESLLRRDPELERTREAAATTQAERQRREQDAAAAEAEVNALQARITALDRRLYGGSVHNPQDLLEMQRELEVLRRRQSEAEDRALDALGEAETATAAEQAGLGELQAGEARRAAALTPLEERLARQRAELEQATAEREAIVTSLDTTSLGLYRRVAQRRTPAVVGLAGDACGGCHLPLSTEERRQVKAGTGIVQCSNCDRVLVP
ncbi:MAG TPA: C4-type zinc ribbon domain-containing protein [Candidatus Dormibacteraeota bacterium]